MKMPCIGQGMGEYKWGSGQVSTIRRGIDLGSNFIDTGENYDNGNSEIIIGKAIRGIRDKTLIGTKFDIKNSSYNNVIKSVEGSLKRLKTDYIDLYQMHWPSATVPFEDTLSAMSHLLKQGKIRNIGIGNVYINQIKEIVKIVPDIYSIQMEYNFFDRLVEKDIIPYCEDNNILFIAYTPTYHGKICLNKSKLDKLKKIAIKYEKTAIQLNLRWLIYKKTVVAIPSTSNVKHLESNVDSVSFDIGDEDISIIDSLFDQTIFYIDPKEIEVSLHGEYNREVYTNISEAIENKLNSDPSPLELSCQLKNDDFIKPVHLLKKYNGKYDLIGGRIRYWAWNIAFPNRPIPSYIIDK